MQHTLYHLPKLCSSRGSSQLTCSKESCQTTSIQHFPENWTSGSLTLHMMGTQKENLHSWRRSVLFSGKGEFIKKKIQAFPIKTRAKEKISCNYGTFAQHQNLCWRYLSRHSNLGTPDYAVLIKIAFPPCISFQWKIFIHYRDNHTITKLLQKEDSSNCW